jgi:hypothetical protein
MVQATQTATTSQYWIFALIMWVIYSPMLGWLIWKTRRASPRANVKRRLLVKDADGQLVWHTVRGRILVGWQDSKEQVVSSGRWGEDGRDWAVIRTKSGKMVAYRFDKYESDQPKTGVIVKICNSWRELESAVPAKVSEEALLAAGIKKPSEYREVPLEL